MIVLKVRQKRKILIIIPRVDVCGRKHVFGGSHSGVGPKTYLRRQTSNLFFPGAFAVIVELLPVLQIILRHSLPLEDKPKSFETEVSIRK